MGMVVRIDKAGDEKLSSRVDNFHAIDWRNGRLQPFDNVPVDEEIGRCGLMDVFIMIVDLAAPDQKPGHRIRGRHWKAPAFNVPPTRTPVRRSGASPA